VASAYTVVITNGSIKLFVKANKTAMVLETSVDTVSGLEKGVNIEVNRFPVEADSTAAKEVVSVVVKIPVNTACVTTGEEILVVDRADSERLLQSKSLSIYPWPIPETPLACKNSHTRFHRERRL
jgi:hypothetical protein